MHTTPYLHIHTALFTHSITRPGGVISSIEPGDPLRFKLGNSGYHKLITLICENLSDRIDDEGALEDWMKANHVQFGDILYSGWFLEFDHPERLLEFRLKTGL